MQRPYSIRTLLAVMILICYLVPVAVLGGYLGFIYTNKLESLTITALTAEVENESAQCRTLVDSVIALSRAATYDGELTDAHSSFAAGHLTESEYLRICRNYIERRYGGERLLTCALFYPLDGQEQSVTSRSGYEDTLFFRENLLEEAQTIGAGLDTRFCFLQREDHLFLVRNLLDNRLERFGMLVLGVNTERLLAPLTRLGTHWNAQMRWSLDDVGTLSGEERTLPEGIRLPQRGNGLLYRLNLEERDYTLSLLLNIPRSVIFRDLDTYRALIFVLMLALVPVLLYLLHIGKKTISDPVLRLSEAANKVKEGQFGTVVTVKGSNELSQLGNTFSEMSVKIQELIDTTYREQLALKDAQIQAMQSRINPHFLNNALETINWEARLEGSENISAMVEALSVLLNASMNRSNRRIVALHEEVEVMNAYLYFISLRFGERLQTHLDIPKELEPYPLPLLTIQPVLENAIEHGIAPAGGGEIAVHAAYDRGYLQLRITNSGRPLSQEDWGRINEALSLSAGQSTHLGLANIALRLHLLYGDDAHIHVTQEEEGAITAVILQIPSSLSVRNESNADSAL